MLNYRGFQLIEYAVVHPPRAAGRRGIAVHCELAGVVHDADSAVNAQLWIDAQCQIADQLLLKALRQ